MSLDPDEAVPKAVERKEVLLRLREGPVRASEIEGIADVSTSTAYRIMRSLEDVGFVERKGSEYSITPTGEAVTERVSELFSDVRAVAETSEILRVLDGTGVKIGPDVFAQGEVVLSERNRPYEPARRFVELLRDSSELRLLAVSSATPMFSDEMHRMIADGRETEIICPESIVKANVEDMSEELIEELPNHLSVFVHGSPPVTVALFDDRVGFGGHDYKKGTLDVFADTEDERAYAEAEKMYDRYREEAERFL